MKLSKFILLFIIVLLIPVTVWSQETFTIETKYGTEQVVIPDGYTAEQVLLAVSKAYYEQNYEFKELQSKIENLTELSNSYIEENKSLRSKYEDLITDYDILVKKIDTYYKLGGFIKGFLGGHYTKNIGDLSNSSFGINAGIILLNTVILEIGVDYPLSFTVSASYLLD